MKKQLLVLMLVAVAATTSAATPLRVSSHTSAAKQARGAGRSVRERTIIGYIADSHCGMNHHKMKWNLDAKQCALKCAEEGRKLGLVIGGSVYELNDEAQEQARQLAGQKVRVTGRVNSKVKTIRVTKMEAAS